MTTANESPNLEIAPKSTANHVRIFLSSPGDVVAEREAARVLVKEALPVHPMRGKLTLELISWDDPYTAVPLDAGTSPQAAVNRYRPRPSECDIAVVVLWSRMGTPLPDTWQKSGGGRFGSGTEWEYEDAVASKACTVLVYQRTEKPQVDLDDPELQTKQGQYQDVLAFCKRIETNGGVNRYPTADDFRQLLQQHLLELLSKRLAAFVPAGAERLCVPPAYEAQ